MPPEALDGMQDDTEPDTDGAVFSDKSKADSSFKSGLSPIDHVALDTDDAAKLRAVTKSKAWDSFGFAVLIAGLFNRTVDPYAGMAPRKVMIEVLLRELRPPLPTVLSPQFHKLLVSMWQQDAAKRPTMSNVLDALDDLNHPFSPRGQAYVDNSADDESQSQTSVDVDVDTVVDVLTTANAQHSNNYDDDDDDQEINERPVGETDESKRPTKDVANGDGDISNNNSNNSNNNNVDDCDTL